MTSPYKIDIKTQRICRILGRARVKYKKYKNSSTLLNVNTTYIQQLRSARLWVDFLNIFSWNYSKSLSWCDDDEEVLLEKKIRRRKREERDPFVFQTHKSTLNHVQLSWIESRGLKRHSLCNLKKEREEFFDDKQMEFTNNKRE